MLEIEWVLDAIVYGWFGWSMGQIVGNKLRVWVK